MIQRRAAAAVLGVCFVLALALAEALTTHRLSPARLAAAPSATRQASVILSATPTDVPTVAPTVTAVPTATLAPTSTAVPTAASTATARPTAQPTTTPQPVASPTEAPALTVGGPMPRLRIPKIGVNASIESVGLVGGAMDVPRAWADVAWYSLGPQPGQLGNAVIDGHLDSDVAPAVFWYLGNLGIGDHIFVDWNAQTHLDFAVRDMRYYGVDNAPMNLIFGSASRANLNLITCSGTWNSRAGGYSSRLIVFSSLVN